MKKNSNTALLSIGFGCLSWLVFSRPIFGIFGIPAITVGIVALKEISKKADFLKGKGFAIGGIILGTIGLLLFLFFMIIIIPWEVRYGK